MCQDQNEKKVAEIRTYLNGVTKNLLEKLFPGGIPWGTSLSEIEDLLLLVRADICQSFLDQGLANQAISTDSLPDSLHCCPSCQSVFSSDDISANPRVVSSRVGQANWNEPEFFCSHCRRRRAFFPSKQELAH